MNTNISEKKLNISNKIYPLFYGLTADLIFWIAIETLFLTTVKHLSGSQINLMTSISTIVAIIVQIYSIKIIRKIGNINSIKLGTLMLLMASILLTFSKSYTALIIGNTFYLCGLVFKQMDNVVLMKNLKYQNRSGEYIKIQTQGSIVYSFSTMIISLISGYLFNYNAYLPMIICIIVCFLNFILSHLIYEVDVNPQEVSIKKEKFKLNKILFLIILLYGSFYAAISMGQENSKLFMQNNMEQFLSLDRVVIYLSYFIIISRIIRLISNSVFLKVYDKLKDKIIYLIGFSLIFAFVLLLLGNIIGKGMIGIIIMGIGFMIFLAIRDPFENYMRTILLENCAEKFHDISIVYIALSRKIGNLILSGAISVILLTKSYEYVMIFLMILSIIYIGLIRKILSIQESNHEVNKIKY